MIDMTFSSSSHCKTMEKRCDNIIISCHVMVKFPLVNLCINVHWAKNAKSLHIEPHRSTTNGTQKLTSKLLAINELPKYLLSILNFGASDLWLISPHPQLILDYYISFKMMCSVCYVVWVIIVFQRGK